MRQFGHDCAKRTLLWSTSRGLRAFAMGRLQKKNLPVKKHAAEYYVDSRGRKCFKGGAAMKATQLLAFTQASS